jgi:hypothetical protein
MDGLKKDDILRYFDEINKHLASTNERGEILIAGGAALTLVFDARDSTYDIDAIFEPKEDMRQIIKAVARANSLDDDWLNDAVKGFMTDKMNFSTFLEYSHLTVSSLDAESLLAMKLVSARPAPAKDMQDSIFLIKILGISSEEQLYEIIEKYTHYSRHTLKSKYFAMEAFAQYVNNRHIDRLKTAMENGVPYKQLREMCQVAEIETNVLVEMYQKYMDAQCEKGIKITTQNSLEMNKDLVCLRNASRKQDTTNRDKHNEEI